jgi:two-component system NtrC family response regulator
MAGNPKILVAEDDPKFQELMRFTLEKHGFEVTVCNDGAEAKEVLDHNPVELIISDYVMPNMDGLLLLKTLRGEGRDTPFILMTAHGSIDSTMEAIKLGTVEYLTKPFDPEEIVLAAQKALNMGHITRELSELREAVRTKYSFDNLIGQSPSMQEAYRNIHKASQTMANVLISGETGTGKELAARAIHYNGLCKKGPFIPMICSAFSGGTLESELFGHVKGAFTDAYRDHKGRFELADQGTLFLDEVGDVPLSTQVKLLRVLQEKRFEPVGGQQTLSSDFRLIAAANRDLKDLVGRGLFREDLFFRLSVINITMPPLRKHPEDIPLLVKRFLQHYTQINRKDIKTLSMEAMRAIQSHPWPGNVRQLENVVESAVAMCEGNMIKLADLQLELTELPSERTPDSEDYQGSLPEVVAAVERQMIQKALDQNEWVKARAAKALGVSERVLSYKVDKYGLGKG